MTHPDETLEIRPATLADEANILALAPRLIAFGPPPWRDPDGMRATDRKVLAAALRAQEGVHTVLVAVVGSGVIAGFIHLREGRDYYIERSNGHVADIVVAEAHEGQGIARALLAAAERWALANGYEWLTISVFKGNERAANLYEHLGFGTDIVQMVKPLKTPAQE